MRFSPFFLLMLLLVACHNTSSISADNELIMAIENVVRVRDPRLATDALSSRVNKLVYSGLMTLNESMQIVPDLAKSFTQTTPTTYTFQLRQKVLFHNLQPLTAHDVKATYESMMQLELNSPYLSSLSIIKQIKVPNDYTVIFELQKPHRPFLTLMSLGILCRSEITETKSNQNLAGTGPYIWHKVANEGSLLTLKRFDDYFGTKAKMPFITFKTMTDGTLLALELLKGRVDLAQGSVPYILTAPLVKENKLMLMSQPSVNFTYMAFNFKHPALQNIFVRQALSHAIDRQKLIKYKLAGLAQTTSSILIPQHWARLQALPEIEFDLLKAKELLNASGFLDPDDDGPQTRFKLIYKTSMVRERIEMAQLIAEDFKKIGIDVEVRPTELGTLFSDLRVGNFDIFTLTLTGATEPDIYYSIYHSGMTPPKGMNRGHYMSERMDQLLEASRVESDSGVVLEIFNEIQELSFKDLPYIPLWHENVYALMTPKIKNYRTRPDAQFLGLVNTFKESRTQ